MTDTLIRIPAVETERLVMRAPRPDDFEAFAAFRASDRARILGGPFSRADAFEQFAALIGHWHVRGFGRWMVTDKATGEPLGVVGLFHPEDWPEPEIAWSLFDAAEGRGIAFEAALASRDYAYRVLRWRTAVSLVAPENARSIALARRLGAEHESDYLHETLGTLQVYRHRRPS